ncbi:MAG: RsmD family RNA methyltransferase [Actinomycetota bacterium]|nr:RsmD family RNA methyltransferase [Actinomycetota bacterium]
MSVRVVSGAAGGRRLVAPKGLDTRPTGDRVRQATFDALTSLGVIEDAVVLDLFAGSGAMGIEALSRGAATATFVDTSVAAVAAIEANLATTGLTARATVERVDAARFVSTSTSRWDLAVVDPPYATDAERWEWLLSSLDADVVVAESDREIEPGPGRRVLRVGRYGSTVVTLTRRT